MVALKFILMKVHMSYWLVSRQSDFRVHTFCRAWPILQTQGNEISNTNHDKLVIDILNTA